MIDVKVELKGYGNKYQIPMFKTDRIGSSID
jgi:hypothetical protein